jgi:integrase/recombinase XerD
MIDLCDAVEDYLNVRRSLGYVLARHGRLLPEFVEFVQVAGIDHVTTGAALAWATQPQATHPAWWRQRLGIVRGFARFLKTIDPATEVPPTDLLPVHRPRVTPYLYSDDDIAALLAAAAALRPCFRAATYSTLVGLLTVTGLRVGEAIALDRHDVDLDTGVLVVRHAKLDKTREACLHDTTVAALGAYALARDSLRPNPTTPSFFVSTTGTRIHRSTVGYTFRQLIADAGLEGRGSRCRPRAHDLRHSFAVRTLLGWYRDGLDVEARLPLLSTFMGHVDPGATYWYLQAAPELLAIAGHRLEHVLGDLP